MDLPRLMRGGLLCVCWIGFRHVVLCRAPLCSQVLLFCALASFSCCSMQKKSSLIAFGADELICALPALASPPCLKLSGMSCFGLLSFSSCSGATPSPSPVPRCLKLLEVVVRHTTGSRAALFCCALFGSLLFFVVSRAVPHSAPRHCVVL